MPLLLKGFPPQTPDDVHPIVSRDKNHPLKNLILRLNRRLRFKFFANDPDQNADAHQLPATDATFQFIRAFAQPGDASVRRQFYGFQRGGRRPLPLCLNHRRAVVAGGPAIPMKTPSSYLPLVPPLGRLRDASPVTGLFFFTTCALAEYHKWQFITRPEWFFHVIATFSGLNASVLKSGISRNHSLFQEVADA